MHYNKIYASILAVLALVIGGINVSAQSVGDAPAMAAEYLSGQDSTALSVMALVAYGQSIDTAFLKSVDTSTAIAITKPIMAIVAAGEDPRTYPDTDLVAALKGYFDGTQFGSDTQINDDVWSILALSAVGESDGPESAAARAFILANQNTDGGWSWGVGNSSDTDDTAAAVMALLESGSNGSDESIARAISYIKGNQNNDGGFYSNSEWGTDSNSSSDAWVIAMINALGENADSWKSGGLTPIDHMLSLQDDDGGFWWVTAGTSDFNNKASTADALIALLGKSYPVAKMNKAAAPDQTVAYRIEGSAGQVCAGEILAVTALDVVKNASEKCGFSYNIEDTDWGPYLSGIGDDNAEGLDGWLYFVNWQTANVGASDYILNAGDSVLWYYGQWGWQPQRVTLDAHDDLYSVGETISGIVESYDGSEWTALVEAEVLFNGSSAQTGPDGRFSLPLTESGVFDLVAEKANYVRSETASIVAGEDGQSVDLSVEVAQSTSDTDTQQTKAGFTVTPASLSFGVLVPGENNEKTLMIANTGQIPLSVGVSVSGDSIFSFLKIAGAVWSSFEQAIDAGEEKNVAVALDVPVSFAQYGTYAGSLIFWAKSAN